MQQCYAGAEWNKKQNSVHMVRQIGMSIIRMSWDVRIIHYVSVGGASYPIEIPDKPRTMGADACSVRTRLQAAPTR
jgi:hypothetical protein